jgi:putative transcription factor
MFITRVALTRAMNCEMCGKDGPLFTTLVEGITLKLCKNCSSMGKVLSGPVPVMTKAKPGKPVAAPRVQEPETVLTLVDDHAARIRKARERLGLTQKEFALKLNEKESVISKLESGTLEPSLDMARKLERLLHIRLVEEQEQEKAVRGQAASSGTMTIGDMLKK